MKRLFSLKLAYALYIFTFFLYQTTLCVTFDNALTKSDNLIQELTTAEHYDSCTAAAISYLNEADAKKKLSKMSEETLTNELINVILAAVENDSLPQSEQAPDKKRKPETNPQEINQKALKAAEERLAKKIKKTPTADKPQTSTSITSTAHTFPIEAQILQNVPITHLEAPEHQTDGKSCGSRVLITSWALDQVVTYNKPVTYENIKNYFDTKKAEILIDELDAADFATLNTVWKCKLDNYFVLNQELGHAEWKDKGDVDDLDDSIYAKIEAINKTCGTLHFYLNVHAHWILVTYLKRPDEKPVLFYINSTNAPLTDDYTASNMIFELWNRFFAPFLE